MCRQLLTSLKSISRMVFSRRAIVLGLMLVLLLVDAGPGQADTIVINRKISGLMPNDFSDVANYLFSPDSQYVVFTADRDVSGMDELYSVRLPFGEPVKLSDVFINGGSVDDGYEAVAISSDSQRVVYIADQDTDTKNELYSVPIDGSAEPVKINRVLSYWEDVLSMKISPDGHRVVYLVEDSSASPHLQDLYSIPIAGPGEDWVRLGPDLEAGRWFKDFQITPDSLRVVYIADAVLEGKSELYSVLITGSNPIKVSGVLPDTGFGVRQFAIAPTLGIQKVIFTAYAAGNSIVELFANVIDDSTPPAPTELSDISHDIDMRQVIYFALTSDSQRVVYSADQETNGIVELYSNSISGGTPVKLSGTLDPDVDVDRFSITPNDQGVVWLTVLHTSLLSDHLYGNYIDGSVPTPVPLDDLPTGRTIKSGGSNQYFAVTPNSAVVVYIADQNTQYKDELFGKLTTGGTSARLSAATMQANGDVSSFRIAGNAGVVYLADQVTENCNELYFKAFLPLESQPFKLNLPLLTPNSDVGSYQISPNNLGVAYKADLEVDEKAELYLWYLAYPNYLPQLLR